LFDSLRDRLPAEAAPEVVYDPNGDVAHYLRAAADTHVFQVGRDDPSRLSNASLEEVLEAAIGFEKDTVVFFLGVREMVPDELGGDELDRLIREEMDHISSLTRLLQAAQGASSD
jgi:rubrerythrin